MGTPSWRGSPAFSWKANSPFSSSCLACLVLQTGLLWSLRGALCPLWDAARGADPSRSPLSTVHLGGQPGAPRGAAAHT